MKRKERKKKEKKKGCYQHSPGITAKEVSIQPDIHAFSLTFDFLLAMNAKICGFNKAN